MTENEATAAYADRLEHFRAEGRLRRLPEQVAPNGLVDLCSNDYLGLGARSDSLAAEFLDSSRCREFSSSASRLLSSRQEEHARLEALLDSLYDKSSLLFNSGYHANCGAISALAIPGTALIADKLAHASMIDGLTLSRASFDRFPHNDVERLRRILEKHAEADRQIVIVESIYSMDGDLAPLCQLVALKNDFPRMLLYVDEAHAFGVRGERGLGLTEELGLIPEVDIIVGTFGKAAASSGAFIASSPLLRDYLLNTARSFIFSTALPPVNMAFTRFVVEKITRMQREREHLREISLSFRQAIEQLTGSPCASRSQIVPWIIGDAARAVTTAEKLRDAGFLALPIRRPTVAPGTERIRFSLSAALSSSQLTPLIELLSTTLSL